MAGELIDMAAQFRGLPMSDLIGGPLRAACDAQTMLAAATAKFIEDVGFLPQKTKKDNAGKDVPDGQREVRTAQFKFTRPSQQAKADGTSPLVNETVELNVPMLAIVNVPSLFIKTVDITFDMEVKSAFRQVRRSEGRILRRRRHRLGALQPACACRGFGRHASGNDAILRQLREISCFGSRRGYWNAGRPRARARHHAQRDCARGGRIDARADERQRRRSDRSDRSHRSHRSDWGHRRVGRHLSDRAGPIGQGSPN